MRLRRIPSANLESYSCEKNLVFKVPKAKSEIRVPKTSRKKAPCAKKIRVIRAIRVQKNLV